MELFLNPLRSRPVKPELPSVALRAFVVGRAHQAAVVAPELLL